MSVAVGSALALALACALAACTGGIQGIGSGTETEAGFTVGGTVSGLTGRGLTLQNNGGDTLTVTANGSFTFNALLLPGDSYDVVVSGQPTSPTQTCAAKNGTGTVSGTSITNITVTCAAKSGTLDTIGGTVSGDLGTGLVLQNNGGDNITVANGSFTFPTALPSGFPYDVTVLSPPINPYQNCTVTNASGTTGTTDVNDVTVSCVTNNNPTYTIGGTISGLTTSHGTIVLQDNGRDNLTLSQDGKFTFALPIPSGSFYDVTSSSLTGPVSLTCSFSNASGLVGSSNVTDIAIVCVPESTTPLTKVTINVSGLLGKGLVLQDNGADNLPITSNGSFSFAVQLPNGTPYDVTVFTQPTNPTQLCTVTNGSGTVHTGVAITVTVTCQNAYTIGGTVQGYTTGTGLSIADNGGAPLALSANGAFTFPTPLISGAAYSVTIVTQPTGSPPVPTCLVQNGKGTVASANIASVLISCSVGSGTPKEWTWESGSNAANPTGVYGMQGTPAPGNVPGGRYGAVSFIDAANDLYLFGGTNTAGSFNDLWEYNPGTTEWVWLSGSNTLDATGVYGTQGVPAPGNVPPARYAAVSWTDAAGHFWFFGGAGGEGGDYNDLWEYTPPTPPATTGLWTWVSGGNGFNANGVYGTLGSGAPGNVPGARYGAVSWIDASGRLWLFGGFGYGAAGPSSFSGFLNDLWFYDPGKNTWTWMGGSTATAASGVYGTLGVAAGTNIPGARQYAVAWTDHSGHFWLMGGDGKDSTGNVGYLNDLWLYDPAKQVWTWESGSNIQGAAGVYGTQGVPAPGNTPGGRQAGATWVDTSGNLWLFGGTNGYASDFNDLWEFAPPVAPAITGIWTWVGGPNPNVLDSVGNFGTLGMAAPSNLPPSRDTTVTWTDSFGNFWLFGGNGFVGAAALYPSLLGDLWTYTP